MAYITFQPKDHFNTKLYTGNGSTQNITGVGHQVDWTWIKYRTDTEGHGLFDVLRGALYRLQSNSTGASSSQAGTVTAFGSDGFSLGSNAEVNANNGSYVSWNWKANGQGSANSDGTITTTYTSANTTSGVSISKFVGTGANATVGHGLGVVPSMYMVKKLDSSGSWGVYHKSLSATRSMFLDLNDTGGTHIDYWNNTEPTSSVFSVGISSTMNHNGQNMIAYAFAEKKGFSKFGSYSANNNADGPMIYTGFSPSFVIIKSSNDTRDWCILDNKRPGYNVVNKDLRANETDVENTQDRVDFLSNGFKLRNASGAYNSTGNTYIYMAFAEAPLVSSNGIPAVAR